jgi:hypothetical protein
MRVEFSLEPLVCFIHLCAIDIVAYLGCSD